MWFLWDALGKVSSRQQNLWVWNSRETFWLETDTWSPEYKTAIKGQDIDEMAREVGADSEKRH